MTDRYDTDLVIDEDEYDQYPYQINPSEWLASRPGVVTINVSTALKPRKDDWHEWTPVSKFTRTAVREIDDVWRQHDIQTVKRIR